MTPTSRPAWTERALACARSDVGATLIITVVWLLVLTAAGVLFDHSFSPRAAAGQDITLLTHMKGFDAEWYRGIIDLGFYESEPGSPAFYPLFPLLVGAVKALSLGVVGTYAAGAVVNTVAVWLAVLALVKIGDTFVAQRHRWAPVMLFLASPAAFFLHVF